MKSNLNLYHDQSMHKGAPASSFKKAKILRKNMTPAEKIMWRVLKNKQLMNFKFRSQHPLHIYIVDFYCHELGLIIEIDGEYHSSASQINKDYDRSELLKFQDLHIIRFTNYEVTNSIEEVLNKLKLFVSEILLQSNEK